MLPKISLIMRNETNLGISWSSVAGGSKNLVRNSSHLYFRERSRKKTSGCCSYFTASNYLLLTSQICHFVFYSKLPSPFKCAKSAKPLRKLRIFSLRCSSFSISYNFRKAGEIANYKKNSKEENHDKQKAHAIHFFEMKK